MTACIARKLILGGRVQGVGFRPFVYRVAHRCGVQGWVRNRAGEVEVLVQGAPELLQRFRDALVTEAPPWRGLKFSQNGRSRRRLSRTFKFTSVKQRSPSIFTCRPTTLPATNALPK